MFHHTLGEIPRPLAHAAPLFEHLFVLHNQT
jgi:hypothetical protein